MKARKLFPELVKYIDHKNALLITGMRQVGKTTLMKQLFDFVQSDYKIWFDFDNPMDLLAFEETDYNHIYSRLAGKTKRNGEKLFVFIDEIQNFLEITRIVKYLIDHYGVKFILTGSYNFYLKNLFPESLSGRKFVFHLSPLSFPEFLVFKDVIPEEGLTSYTIENMLLPKKMVDYNEYRIYYDDYLEYGGFPEVALTEDPATRALILKNIFSSFFEKDLILMSDFRDIRELRDRIRLLAVRVGSTLDITRISSELGVDRRKVYSYIEYLQGTFFIRLIPRLAAGIDKSIAGGKKICYCDNGILN